MRIVYLLHYNDGPIGGVFHKVIGQVTQWVLKNAEVAIFLLTRETDNSFWTEAAKNIPVFSYSYINSYTNLSSRLRQTAQIVRDIQHWQPDLVYFRHDLYYPPYHSLLHAVPVVLEINGDDLSEFQLQPKLRNLYNRVTRSLLFSNVKGMVFVSQEVSERAHFLRYGKPRVTIANGIDLEQYPNVLTAPCNPEPRLVFLSSEWVSWEGVDKILWLAYHFPDWHFDLIGKKTNNLFSEPPPNATLYPPMHRAKYEAILGQADVAIGALACERVGMHEASSLGIRECLAYGIPCMVGYHETDFDTPKDFLLELPSTPDNVTENVALIAQFVIASQGQRVPRGEICHLDNSVKEQARLRFFSEVLDNG
ncbi:MAG: glycosyltransferase [Anaerolineae bacterium]|nr:glycosyltransferase [Anaerolineae bacterium]